MKTRYLIPLALFVLIAVFLGIGLKLDPKEVPSPLIGKPAPAFELPSLENPEKTVSTADFKGKIWLFNVWATWCVSCRAEHETLVEFSRQNVLPIVGLNYKDDADAAKQWLATLGNPYIVNAFDKKGRVGIDWGVYGTPETYLIDQQGIIRFKQIGAVTPKVIQDKLLPMIKSLRENPPARPS